jgi:hypothetical protein
MKIKSFLIILLLNISISVKAQDTDVPQGHALVVRTVDNSVGIRLFGRNMNWVPNVNGGYMQMYGSYIYDDGGLSDPGVGGLHFANGASLINIHSGMPGSTVGIQFNAWGNSYFNSGKLGIGTTNPQGHFQVAEGPYKTNIGEADGPALYYGTGYMGFNAARNDNHTWTTNHDGFNNGGGVMYSNIFGDIFFAPIKTSTLNSTSNFNQTLSDEDIRSRIAFSINRDGIVRAKEIRVETSNWPDYVFKPSYQLRSLASVEAYIDKNKHLPDMPSEMEVVKEGVDLGKMNKLLLKKVEELTLYLVAQQRVNQGLNSRIKSIEKKLSLKKKTIKSR